MKNIYKIVFWFALFSLGFQACKKEFEKPNWDVGILAPLAYGSLTLDDIVDDSLVSVGANNLVFLSYGSDMYSMKLDSMFVIPDTSIEFTVNLENLDIGEYDFTYRTSLGDIALYDLEENGPGSNLYTTIMNAHNFGIPATIDPVDQQVFNDIAIDASEYFESVEIESGYMDIIMNNQMPMAITNLTFELRNADDGTVVFQDVFDIIPPNSELTRTSSLEGITLEGNLVGVITLESPGTPGDVIIDTAMSLTASIVIRDLVILSATAVFPNQDLIDMGEQAVIDPGNGVQLSEVLVREGKINIDIYNTIQQPMHFNLKLFSALLGGIPLEITGDVPAGTVSGAGHFSVEKDVSDYYINFRGVGSLEAAMGDLNGNGIIDSDTINSLYYEITGGIDSTGNMITLTQDDSLYLNLSFSNIIPEYGKGFLGYHIAEESGIIDFEVLNEIDGAELSLENVLLSLQIKNQIGVEGAVFINELTSINSRTGASVSLSGPIMSEPLYISKPTDPLSPYTDVIPANSSWLLSNSNSNIQELISNLPDKLSYNLRVETNYNIAQPIPGSGTDFVYYGDEISASISLEVPLSLKASNLTLSDTVAIDLSSAEIEDVLGGNLILITDNYFPFQAELQMFIMDTLNNITDSLFLTPQIAEAGVVNTSSGIVDVPQKSKLVAEISKDKLKKIVEAGYVKIVARFDTRPVDTHVSIYSYYSISFKLVADFKYHLN
ncbi:MAG: hypothetical protein JXR58_02020 [Bacteroidales bacterium]|nr:hypothetical protein [Bacteroidales bacterium]